MVDDAVLTLPVAVSLPDAPTDGITGLVFLPKTTMLASSSWDGSVRIHETGANNNTTVTTDPASPDEQSARLLRSHAMQAGPCLCIDATTDTVIVGSLDGSIRALVVASNSSNDDSILVGQHVSSNENDRVACSRVKVLPVANNPAKSVVVSAGWHSKLHIWDLEPALQSAESASIESSIQPLATVDLPGKAFDMDVDAKHSRILIACSGRRNVVVQVEFNENSQVSSAKIVLDRESSLQFQSRCISFFNDGSAFALGSVEGRVAVEYLEELGMPAKKMYAFKCHREGQLVYPVSCLAFHPTFGTFASGGCDGKVFTWDGWNKKKLTALPKFPTSIAALAFNDDGSKLAIASSYTFEDGEREHPREEIYIRTMLESECRPKQIT